MALKIAAIIPVRWASTRFPGKPLHMLAGRPMIQHVWERAMAADQIDRVIVATDDMRIADAAFAFGAEVSLTSPDHESGTDRVAEVSGKLKGYNTIINVQGDEPTIEAKLIDRLAKTMRREPKIEMITAASPMHQEEDLADPNQVKVVIDRHGDALYFSRSRIPFPRDSEVTPAYLRHHGIYGYRTSLLKKFVRWKPSPLEVAEKLEQLRALERGIRIRVMITDLPSHGVDTPEDAVQIEKYLS